MFFTLKLVVIFELLYSYSFSKKLSVRLLGVISSLLFIEQNLFFGVIFSILSILGLRSWNKINYFKVALSILVALYFYWGEIIYLLNTLFGLFIPDNGISQNDSLLGLFVLCYVFNSSDLEVNPRLLFFGNENITIKTPVFISLIVVLFCEVFYNSVDLVFLNFPQTNMIQTWVGIISFVCVCIGFNKIVFNKTKINKSLIDLKSRLLPKPQSKLKWMYLFVVFPLMVKLPFYQYFFLLIIYFLSKATFFKRFKIIKWTFIIGGIIPALLSPNFQKYKEIIVSLINPVGVFRYYNELYITYSVGLDLMIAPLFVILFILLLKFKFHFSKKIAWMEQGFILLILLGILI